MNRDKILREKRKTFPPPPVIQEIRSKYIEDQVKIVHSEKHRDFTQKIIGHEATEEELWNHFVDGGGAVNFCIHMWREFWRKRGIEESDKTLWLKYWQLRRQEKLLKKKLKQKIRQTRQRAN